MPVDFETLTRFTEVASNDVRLRDSQGHTRMFSPDEPEMREYVADAQQFYYRGKSYARAEFETIVQRVLAGESPRR